MVEQRTAPDALAYAVEETEANAEADALEAGPLAWHREVLRHLNAAGWILVPSDARQSGDRPAMIRRRARRRPRRGEVPLRDWFSVRDPYRQVRTEVFLARLRAASRSVPADR